MVVPLDACWVAATVAWLDVPKAVMMVSMWVDVKVDNLVA